MLKTGKIVSLYITHCQIFFFDVIGITFTHLLVFKHRLGALDILKEKNSAEAFAICNIYLYPQILPNTASVATTFSYVSTPIRATLFATVSA